MKSANGQSTRRHYRLDFIAENTYNRVWSVRMTRTRVFMVSLAAFAAVAALIFVILAYTPLRGMLPGALRGDLRTHYLEATLRVDSLETAVRANEAYIAGLTDIFNGVVREPDTAGIAVRSEGAMADSLLAASEAEREFVRRYREEERFNVSVLAPIAAEGMVFVPPTMAAVSILQGNAGSVAISARRPVPVSAVYRGTVVSTAVRPDGLTTVTVQHPNDFLSVYDGVGDVFVEKGDKVQTGQRLAHTAPDKPVVIELWHNGSALNPQEYIAFQ